MNERLKIIRKELSLSQEAFGKNWASPELLISCMEIGNRTVTEDMILAENDIMNNDDFGIGNCETSSQS